MPLVQWLHVFPFPELVLGTQVQPALAIQSLSSYLNFMECLVLDPGDDCRVVMGHAFPLSLRYLSMLSACSGSAGHCFRTLGLGEVDVPVSNGWY